MFLTGIAVATVKAATFCAAVWEDTNAALLLATCLALQATTVSKQIAALDTQRDPARIEAAAVAIAGSSDAEATRLTSCVMFEHTA